MRQNQHKSSKKDEGQDPILDEIVEDLTSYLKKFSHFEKYEKDIRKKYEKYYNTALPDRWPVEFINKAWIKTKTEMYTFSGRRKCWSLAILLQVMRRSQGYDESEAEEEKNPSHDESEGEEEKNPSHDESEAEEPSDQEQSGGNLSSTGPFYISIPFLEMIKDNKCSSSQTDAMDILESPQNKYKLIDKVPSPTQILQKHSYVTLYNNQTRNAVWVYEILNKSTRANKDVARRNSFIRDASVHTLFQTPEGEDTYKNTGYDRGHLAAAANHMWCQKAYDDTILLSNIIPQQYGFNRGRWRTLEEHCRKTALKEEVRNVHVYSGPLYLSSDNKEDNNDQNKSEKSVEYKFVGGKAVPTHLFKVIIVEKMNGEVLEPVCCKMPNQSSKRKKPEESPEESLQTNNRQAESTEPYLEELKKLCGRNVLMEDIQRDSGLIFIEERTTREEMEDRTWKVHLMKNPDEEKESGEEIEIEVRVSSSYVDHSDRAVLH